MTRPGKPMTPIQVLVLGIVAQKPCGPYEMLKILDQVNVRRWYSVSNPSIYLTVRKLEAQGLLEGVAVREGNNPEKTVYSVTGAGEKTLRESLIGYLEAKDSPLEAINIAILFLCHLEKKTALTTIDRRIGTLREEIEWAESLMRQMESNPEMPFIGRIMVQHGLSIKKALASTLADLRKAASSSRRWDFFVAKGAATPARGKG